MGWAARSNPNSIWNKKRASEVSAPISTLTTDKKHIDNVKVSTPQRDEPVVIEITPKSVLSLFKEFLWHRPKPPQSHALTS